MAAVRPPEAPLCEIAFTVLDIETAGINPDHSHEVIELGMVHCSRGETSDTFSPLFRPTFPVSKTALVINRVDPAKPAIAPTFAEMAEVAIEFIGETVVAALNFLFELTFLDTSLRRLGRPPLGSASR